jgi:phycocyanin beta chain
MHSVFSEAVSKADASGRFLSNQELDALRKFMPESKDRIDIVSCITNNASTIVANSARTLFAEQPQLIAPGGNAYTSRRMAACLRDMEVILRYIVYAMVVEDTYVLDIRCLNGLRETYQALGTPPTSVANGIQNMKRFALDIFSGRQDLSGLLVELASYFDRAAASVG